MMGGFVNTTATDKDKEEKRVCPVCGGDMEEDDLCDFCFLRVCKQYVMEKKRRKNDKS
jgi:predicted nucleic acid-binding Zn ribbon protein